MFSKRRSWVELLAPAGNFEKLEMAIHFGADAVYLGGQQFSLRGHSGNFSPQDLADAVAYCHRRGVRAYITCNTYPREEDLPGLRQFMHDLAAVGPDGVIVSDPAVLMLTREVAPGIPIHISTQANTTNHATAQFWKKLGAVRVNAARELSLEEIRLMSDRSGLAVEVFVHGAMCMAYSGRCLLSSFLAARDGNRGLCAHPCRWNYALMEEKRPGMYMPVQQNDQGSFILNTRDLCMIRHIPALIDAGVRALKIEGRMKGIHYVATVVKAYREAIDAYYRNASYNAECQAWMKELEAVNNRGYETGFFFGPPSTLPSDRSTPPSIFEHRLVGKVLADSNSMATSVEVRNRLRTGDAVEILSPGQPVVTCRVRMIRDTDGESIASARPGTSAIVELSTACRRWDLLRTVVSPAASDSQAIKARRPCS